MAEQYLIAVDDSGNAGKKIRTEQNTVSAVVVQQQVVTLALSDGTLLDGPAAANAMPVKLAQPGSATTGGLGSSSDTVVATVGNYGGSLVTVHGTHSGVNFGFFASDDGGTTYYPVPAVRLDDATVEITSGVLTANRSRAWLVSHPGASKLKVGASAYGSGTATINITPTAGVPSLFPDAVKGTPVMAASTGAASALTPALAAVSGKINYLTGFEVTGGGATAASIIAVTVTGLLGGTIEYRMGIPAGVTAAVTPLAVSFRDPFPASAHNVAVTLNVASFGSGNTDAAAVVRGFVR